MVNTGSWDAVRVCPNPTGSLIGGNQKSHWAISPARYVMRAAGSGGKYIGLSSAPRPLNARIEYGQAIRSAITVAGIVGQACSNSRIRGSTGSTNKLRACPRSAGGSSAAIAFFTVFFEHPTTRAITLIGIRSARYNRRISAQSSTLNTHFPLTSAEVSITEGISFQLPLRGQFSHAVDTLPRSAPRPPEATAWTA